jgi:hypothetical protein
MKYALLIIALLLPVSANAGIVTTYVPDATLQRLADAGSLSDGLYKLNDPANGMVVYLYKQGNEVILSPVVVSTAPAQPQVAQEYPLTLNDPKRQAIYEHLDKAGMASYQGDRHGALDHYEQAESLINQYVDRSQKGRLEITITDASDVKG